MFIILFAIEVRQVQLKSVNILKISAKHFISSHLMLSVLFNKDRIRLFVSNRHTRNDGDTGPVTKGQIHIIRQPSDRHRFRFIQQTDSVWKTWEHRIESSNLDQLLVKWHQMEILSFVCLIDFIAL